MRYQRLMEYYILKENCSPRALRKLQEDSLYYSQKKSRYLKLITLGGAYFV